MPLSMAAVPIFGICLGVRRTFAAYDQSLSNARPAGAAYNCVAGTLDSRVHLGLPGSERNDPGNESRTKKIGGTVVTVDGQLSIYSIGVVETMCSQAKSNGKPVLLYLRDVPTVDQAGQTLL